MKTWSCFFSLYHILWRALCYWYKTRNLAVGKRHRLMKRRARCVWRNRHLKKSTPPQYSTIFFCFFFFTFPLFSFIFKYRPSISLLPFFHQLCGIGSFVICFIFFWKKIGCCFIWNRRRSCLPFPLRLSKSGNPSSHFEWLVILFCRLINSLHNSSCSTKCGSFFLSHFSFCSI